MKIYVATHKIYPFPDDNIYCPIQVGRSLSTPINGMLGDDAGDNISSQNANFCELTALYWLWKNSLENIVGLVHYRRYFQLKINSSFINNIKIPNGYEIQQLMNHFDFIVPFKDSVDGVSIFELYCDAHYVKDLILTRDIIMDIYPDYVTDFDAVLMSSSLSYCNMFIAKKEYVDEYCQWLFDILFMLKERVKIEKYDGYQKRLYGFLSERLFNVWLYHNKNRLRIYYGRVVNLEKRERQSFIKRGFSKFSKLKFKLPNYLFLIRRGFAKYLYRISM